jgi:hypothetical protein
MYLLPSLNLRLRPRLLELSPGTRVLSNSFDMGDWEPDDSVSFVQVTAYLWIVPAHVAGRWKLSHRARGKEETWNLDLRQHFQKLSGRVHVGSHSTPILDGDLDGAGFRFHFTDAAGSRYDVAGQALADALEGALRHADGTSSRFRATPERARSSRTATGSVQAPSQ